MKVAAVIAAAGLGTRLGRGSKALLPLNGRTPLARAVELFRSLPEVSRVVVVAPPDKLGQARADAGPGAEVIAGGATRQESVRAGLSVLHGTDYVLVHDAARPLATAALCRRVLRAAIESGAAFPAVPPRDAVKRVEGGRLVESLDRSLIVLAQTPQAFSYPLLLKAHYEAHETGLSGDDDAQLVAAAGHPVAVVEGDPSNFKLTTAEDLELLEALLREQDAVH